MIELAVNEHAAADASSQRDEDEVVDAKTGGRPQRDTRVVPKSQHGARVIRRLDQVPGIDAAAVDEAARHRSVMEESVVHERAIKEDEQKKS